jgi:hypothetical protein
MVEWVLTGVMDMAHKMVKIHIAQPQEESKGPDKPNKHKCAFAQEFKTPWASGGYVGCGRQVPELYILRTKW